MGPWLGTLQDGSVRVRMGFVDRGLARQGRPVYLWVAAMQDGRVLGRRCPPLMLLGGPGRWWPLGVLLSANPVGSDGPVVTGSPIGPCETLSPHFQDALGPLEHSVPDETILGLDPLEHSGLDQAGPVGRQFADVARRFRLVVPAGGSSSVGTANPMGSDGPIVAGSPIGPCETLSPFFQDALGPLEHSVPDETILGLDPLEHSGLDQAGPVGWHVAGGPVGPDETLLGLDPLEHSGLDRADPAGRHTAVGPVGLFGTLSPSDCYPAGPAGPYVAGGSCWPR